MWMVVNGAKWGALFGTLNGGFCLLANETTWPDVGMEFIKFLTYLAGTCAALYVQYRQLHEQIKSVRQEASRGVEMSGSNAAKLDRVETGLAENTAVTKQVKTAVNGGHKCGWTDPQETISARMTQFQQAMVDQIAALKAELAEARKGKP